MKGVCTNTHFNNYQQLIGSTNSPLEALLKSDTRKLLNHAVVGIAPADVVEWQIHFMVKMNALIYIYIINPPHKE